VPTSLHLYNISTPSVNQKNAFSLKIMGLFTHFFSVIAHAIPTAAGHLSVNALLTLAPNNDDAIINSCKSMLFNDTNLEGKTAKSTIQNFGTKPFYGPSAIHTVC
jgi:hypothetical protein